MTLVVVQYASIQEKPIKCRRGEGGAVRWGGPSWSPAGWGCSRASSRVITGDHEGPPLRNPGPASEGDAY